MLRDNRYRNLGTSRSNLRALVVPLETLECTRKLLWKCDWSPRIPLNDFDSPFLLFQEETTQAFDLTGMTALYFL